MPRNPRSRPLVLVATLVVAMAAGCVALGPGPSSLPSRAVVLVSLDGFRWDYPELYPTPTLDRIAAEGVRAERLVPSFPTKTFPNHYTLVTGLHPGNHGIVANDMWDAELGWFGLGLRDAVGDARWWGGEPIWVAAERRGLATAPTFWPGSEAAIGGLRPRYWQPFDDTVPVNRRVDAVLDALDGTLGDPVAFATLYLEHVDAAGHDFGPRSPETAAAVAGADAAVGRLLAGLEHRGLGHVDVIVVGDHGMAAVSRDRLLLLDDYVDRERVRIVGGSPILGFWPPPGEEAAVLEALRRASPALRVFRREETPEEWHYRRHPRIPPIVAVAAEGWTVVDRQTLAAAGERRSGGAHGYDPATARSMDTVLFAVGPSFRPGARVGPVAAVDVYSLLCRLLDLPPRPHDGDASRWSGLVAGPHTMPPP